MPTVVDIDAFSSPLYAFQTLLHIGHSNQELTRIHRNMEHFNPRNGIEPSSNVGEEATPHFQSLREDPVATDTLEEEFGPKVATLDLMGSNSSSLLPFVLGWKVLPDVSEELAANHDPQPLNAGIIFDFQTDAAEASAEAIPVPLTIVRAGRQLESYAEDVWELHKSRIRQLYIREDKKLREVMQQMREEKGFKPSMKMYKTHLAAWGLFKKNREKDVAALVRLKQARDAAGKSSIILRSGKTVDIHQIYNYLRRKKMNPRDLIQAGENDEIIHVPSHVYIRTPSPTPSPHLLPLPGNIQDKEMMLLTIKTWYTVWIGKTSELRITNDITYPHIFHLAQDGGLKIVDSISVLLQRGRNLFHLNQFAEGGTSVRAAFILVENLFQGMASKESYYERQSPIWIFGLWKLLTEDVPHDISKLFLSHVAAMGRQVLPRMHPVQEIMRCLCRVHNTSTCQVFAHFISSTWADAINEVSSLLKSSWLNAAACLPHTFWMGETNGHLRQLQETVMEFRRVEDIETWQQRNKDLAFVLCNQRQLYCPAPFHTGVLTLIWLRRSVVDSNKAHRSTLLSQESHKDNQSNEICVFKSAILTRLELSLGKENNQGGCDNIRVLSGDVYHVGHLHRPQQGEEIETFKQRHNLDSHGFEKATTMFRATHGVETEKGVWLQWLQILEESLISRWDLPGVCEKQRAESVILHETFRGKGFICNYMATQYGEIGIIDEEERTDPSSLEDGYMYVSAGKFQN